MIDTSKPPQPLEDQALDEASGALPAVQTPVEFTGGVRGADGSVKPINFTAPMADGSVRPGG